MCVCMSGRHEKLASKQADQSFFSGGHSRYCSIKNPKYFSFLNPIAQKNATKTANRTTETKLIINISMGDFYVMDFEPFQMILKGRKEFIPSVTTSYTLLCLGSFSLADAS